MSFINTTRAINATGATFDMYERQENAWGYVPNYAKAFCHRPETMARWGRLLAEVRRPVDDRRFELVTFVVAYELRNSPCTLAHGSKLAGIIGQDAVVEIAKGNQPAEISDAEIAIINYARKIAKDASKITYGEVEALKKIHGLSDADVFDIAAIASARCFFTKILDALGSEPDVRFMQLNRELRQSLTVGRPISASSPEFTVEDDIAV
jgi:alkylhydroperoxidase family enzyme